MVDHSNHARRGNPTPGFLKWFGSSKVVDASGRPLEVYHGTSADFGSFRASPKGIYFSVDPGRASAFSQIRKGQPNVIPAYLNIRNPWTLIRYEEDVPYTHQVDQSIETLKGLGYDGIYIPSNNVDPESWVAFYPEQIKSSISNVGSFDSTNADIRFSISADKAVAANRITMNPESTTAFKSWFGKSQVVDDLGSPIVVYHGSIVRDNARAPGMGDITEFDRLYSTKLRSDSVDTMGSWFSTNPGEGGAQMYSGLREGSVIYPVYLSIRNPHITSFEMMLRRARILANGVDDGRKVGMAEVNAYRKWIQEIGKDGIKIVRDSLTLNESGEFSDQTVWIAMEPEQVKSAIGNNGAFSPVNSDIRFSFAGEQSATATVSLASQARMMSEQGRTPAVIFRETGWFMGGDGIWRYEIDDQNAELIDPPINQEWEHWFVDQSARLLPGIEMASEYASESITHSHPLSYDIKTIKRQLSAEYDRRNGRRFLKDLLSHPELYVAYPSLQDIRVSFTTLPDYQGMYEPLHDRITLDRGLDSETLLSVLLHEVQHAIQSREGFARGGYVDSRFRDYVINDITKRGQLLEADINQWMLDHADDLRELEELESLSTSVRLYNSVVKLKSYANHVRPSSVLKHIRSEASWLQYEFTGNEEARELSRRWYELPKRHRQIERNIFLRDFAWDIQAFFETQIPKSHLDYFKEDTRRISTLVQALQRDASRKRKILSQLNSMKSSLTELGNLKESSVYKSPYSIYRSLAGEIEARNVEKRIGLSANERLSIPPWETEDVGRSESIVLFDAVKDIGRENGSAQAKFIERNDLYQRMSPEIANVCIVLEHCRKMTFLSSFDSHQLEQRMLASGVDPSGAQGIIMNDEVMILTDRVEATTSVDGLILHEIGVHLMKLGRSDEEFDQLLDDFSSLVSVGDAAAVAAFERVPENTPDHLRLEEGVGYLVEMNPQLPLSRRFIAWMKALLRDWLGERNLAVFEPIRTWASALTTDDLVYMARSATLDAATEFSLTAQHPTKQEDQMMSPR